MTKVEEIIKEFAEQLNLCAEQVNQPGLEELQVTLRFRAGGPCRGVIIKALHNFQPRTAEPPYHRAGSNGQRSS